ncbi:MAG: mechanosensitive ion channel [Symploca sp. SIO1C4]|uniref:Mechanosensitive ion channel n=1 Tax=Symploca sp. SIO1C4 TaxID=2607765 RepID=A0A6B3N524_9CYAN|nr:mechanosensitive ion channel [Symploca sp. SIO1C4]
MNLTEFRNSIGYLYQTLYSSSIPNYVIFLGFVFLSILIGRYTPGLISFIIKRFAPQQGKTIYEELVSPIQKEFQVASTLVLIASSLVWLQDYQGAYNFIKPLVYLAVTISIAWLVSRLFRQLLRVYGIELIQKLGLEIDELLLVVETLGNVIIGFIAAIAFAQSQQINLVGLLTSLGIGGIAIAFAAQKTLEQLLGTIVLYLDRPFIQGEYIRVSLNPHSDDVFGRVESIGLRSTKLRTAAKSTLVIVPNSIMANLDIENITRGKKVMVLLYLDFHQFLEERERALVEQIIKESTDALFGIDPGSTTIHLFEPEGNSHQTVTRARVTFFILGSSENSIQLRKRLLELANEKMSKELITYGINFTMQDPTVYVDSPVTV